MVQAAAAARQRAQRDAERLEEEIAGLQKAEQARKVYFCSYVSAVRTHDCVASHDPLRIAVARHCWKCRMFSSLCVMSRTLGCSKTSCHCELR